MRGCYHETQKPREDGGDTPSRVPSVRVKIRNTQTQLSVDFKPSIWGDHVDSRRLERKVAGKYQLSVVKPALVGRIFRPCYHIMPENAQLLANCQRY